MRIPMQTRSDNTFKLNFSAQKTNFSNIKFNKTSNNMDIDAHVRPTDEDIYYDEIIYYDGGGVEGYGD